MNNANVIKFKDQGIALADIVVRATGSRSLIMLLRALAAGNNSLPGSIWIVDDRPEGEEPLADEVLIPSKIRRHINVIPGNKSGPSAARNAGWQMSNAVWVGFLDDDVLPGPGWFEALLRDIRPLNESVAACRGNILGPPPPGKSYPVRYSDVKCLAKAQWSAADIAYRRQALAAVGGFDERFKRAYREGADLGIRIQEAGHAITRGGRSVMYVEPPAPSVIDIRWQSGTYDDLIMLAKHGRKWRQKAGLSSGRSARRNSTGTAAGGKKAVNSRYD